MLAWQKSMTQLKNPAKKKSSPFMRVLELYAVIMLIVVLGWIIYSNLKMRDSPQSPYDLELSRQGSRNPSSVNNRRR